ncbi:hypothetical protein [Shivajiella indica]|uniref:Tetratricopeptide repeat protein n=1 Tax=Shivajiella indica TaxID=872115 RepID=A0ABW5B6U1_9BACT
MPYNMLDDRYIALIDDYLDGILSQEENEKIEAELKENHELQDLLALLKLTRESIRMSGQKQMIQEIHQNFIEESESIENKEKTIRFKISPWWLGIAASLALLILIGNFWVNTQTDSYFERNYVAYNLPTMRSLESQENEIVNLYKTAEFEKITKIITLNSEDSEALFLSGLSHFELGNYRESAQFLKKVQNLNETKTSEARLFQDESDYYLFLTFLKTEDYMEAENYYSRITSQKNHTYHTMIDLQDKVRFSILKLKKKM